MLPAIAGAGVSWSLSVGRTVCSFASVLWPGSPLRPRLAACRRRPSPPPAGPAKKKSFDRVRSKLSSFIKLSLFSFLRSLFN